MSNKEKTNQLNHLRKELDDLFNIHHSKALVPLQLILAKALIESDYEALDIIKQRIKPQLLKQLTNTTKSKLDTFLKDLKQ